MNKILITGNAGSGKSTLASKLADQHQLPAFGLDSIVWQPNWKKTPEEEKRARIEELVKQQKWVIEGVSKQAFLAADTIYFLDIPLSRCLLNILKRFISNGFKTRIGLPPNCPEYIGVFKAIRVAFLYQRKTRPMLMSLENSLPSKNIFWIKSYSDLKREFS
ncbi:hypothetical protein GW916_06785 [bacterium]|nr:hypothetical protein [bacterium]